MKELSIEEKAKAYDGNYKVYTELINRLEDVKEAIKKQNYGIAMDILFKPYPEFQVTTHSKLAESEDEEVRKALYEYFKNRKDDGDIDETWYGISYDEILAWLEKQGEQKPADKVIEEEKPLLEKFKQAVYDCAWGKVTCKKEGESKEEYANRWAEHLLILVRDWADDYIDNKEDVIARRAYDKGKQDIQKSAWSEEDELHIRELESLVKQVLATAEHKNDKDTIHKMSDLSFFLKTLKPQQKQEWRQDNVEELTEFERELRNVIYTADDGWDSHNNEHLKDVSNMLINIARKQIVSEIDEYEMVNKFCESATERVKFDSYFLQEGIRATIKEIKSDETA